MFHVLERPAIGIMEHARRRRQLNALRAAHSAGSVEAYTRRTFYALKSPDWNFELNVDRVTTRDV